MKKAVAIAAMSVLLTLTACNQQGSTGPATTEKPITTVEESKSTPKPAKTPAPAPAPKKKAIALNNGKGIVNGDLEAWEGDVPANWSLENEVIIKGTDDPIEGEVCLQTGPGYYFNQISQPVTVSGDISGKLVRFTAWAKAAEEDTVRLILEFPNGEQIASAPHEGDGEWHLIEISHTLREDRSPKRFKAILNHYNKPERSARFDDVKMVIKDAS